MKNAFTMIELIFVIVIIGILAAVAISKYSKMAEQAYISNFVQYESNLNKVVGPTAWVKVVINNNGDLSYLPSKDQNLSNYIKILKIFSKNGSKDANLSNTKHDSNISNNTIDVLGNIIPTKCKNGKKPFQLEKASGTNPFSTKINGDTYKIAVCNGTKVRSPIFYIYKN